MLKQRAGRDGNQVTVGKDIVDLYAKVFRSDRVEGSSAGFGPVPLQRALSFFGDLLVYFRNDLLKALLQMRGIVDLKNQLPRRRRQNGPIDGERILATQRCGKIVAQIQ